MTPAAPEEDPGHWGPGQKVGTAKSRPWRPWRLLAYDEVAEHAEVGFRQGVTRDRAQVDESACLGDLESDADGPFFSRARRQLRVDAQIRDGEVEIGRAHV